MPPNESFIIRVSFESRYGTCEWFYDRLLITIPKLVNERFIFLACYKTLPYAPVFDTFYPARSIKNDDLLIFAWKIYKLSWFNANKNIIWDLDDNSFIFFYAGCSIFLT